MLDDKTFKTDKDVVSKLIDNYCGIANNKNMEGEKSDNDIALTIGKLCLDNEGVVDDLKSILTKDNCKSGMLEYLKLYDGGKLPAVAEKSMTAVSISISCNINSAQMLPIGYGIQIQSMQNR